jgi:hypothetical protein
MDNVSIQQQKAPASYAVIVAEVRKKTTVQPGILASALAIAKLVP